MADKKDFYRGKVALVTGGSSGIGLALAKQLAARGARVWINGRHGDTLKEAIQQVRRESGGFCEGITADVSEHSQADRLVKQVTRDDALPDLVFNSAGVTRPGYVEDLNWRVFRIMMDINYFGTVYVVKAMLPGMIERGSGHIVNISSGAGFIGLFGYSAYGASKYAVRGFSDVLRVELKPCGIRLSVVFPPDTDTPQLAYEQRYKPHETQALTGNAKVMSADKVAEVTLRGVQRGKYVIVPGGDTLLFYHANNLLGNGIYPIMDMLVRSARRKKN